MQQFKVANMKQKQTVTESANTIWAAAVYAQRINGVYLKQDLINDDNVTVKKYANRTVAKAVD